MQHSQKLTISCQQKGQTTGAINIIYKICFEQTLLSKSFNFFCFVNQPSVLLSGNSSFKGWASMIDLERKIFIPQLDDRFHLLESIKSTSESCSIVFRGKLYIYGQGLTDLYKLVVKSNFSC